MGSSFTLRSATENHQTIPGEIMGKSPHKLWRLPAMGDYRREKKTMWCIEKKTETLPRGEKNMRCYIILYIYICELFMYMYMNYNIYIYIHMKCVYTYIHMKYGFVWKSSASSDPSQGFKPHMAPLWIHTHCPQLPQRVWPWLQVIAARYDKNQLGLEFFCCCSQWKIYL